MLSLCHTAVSRRRLCKSASLLGPFSEIGGHVLLKNCKLLLFRFLLCHLVGQLRAAAPTLVSVSPESGTIGSSVVITGSNFGSSQESSTVHFNGTAAEVKSWSHTRILVTVPSGATTGEVVVIVSGVASTGKNFKIVPAPNGSAVSPPLQTDRHSLQFSLLELSRVREIGR